MTTARQRIIDLLATGRVANLPSVLSNVWLGWALGAFAVTWTWFGPFFDPVRFLISGLAGACLYLGGCFLNDWKDAKWDREHRPERAIPDGRMSSPLAGTIAAGLLLAGLVLAAAISMPCLVTASVLVIAIVIYTAIHKRTRWAIVPMGLCRALLYPLGFLAACSYSAPPEDPAGFLGYGDSSHDTSVVLFFGLIEWQTTMEEVDLINGSTIVAITSLGLFAYIAAISLIARFESRGTLHRSYLIIGLGLILVAACAHTYSWFPHHRVPSLLALIPLVTLTIIAARRAPGNVGGAVGSLLAGIPLLDLVTAGPLAVALFTDHPDSALFWGLLPVVCFLLALLLQRIAPAT